MKNSPAFIVINWELVEGLIVFYCDKLGEC